MPRVDKNGYVQRFDGDRIVIGKLPRAEHKIGCCDCKLVHTMKISVMKNGDIVMRVWRDNRATAQRRKKK